MTDKKILIVLVLLLSFSLTPIAEATVQEQTSGAPAGTDDGMALLKRTADFLSQCPQFSVTIHTGYDVVQKSGRKVEFGDILKVTLRRPNGFRADIERSDGEKGLVSFDGKDIVVFNEKEQVFAKAARPGDLDGAVTYLLSDLKMRLPLAMLFLTRLPFEIERRVLSVDVVERSVIM
ncbi:MAG: DUF2092 domain-containing protein, partial [FCB group bacterium]|nr:DUF2092 domain-containing protein [FCB group bacterium]